MPKIFDCFMAGQEKETLLLRLMEYYDYVDWFIITESRQTHRNTPKELFFLQNLNLYESYMDKIQYIILDTLPFDAVDYWVSETYQRNQFNQALDKLANEGDIVIVSDIDEFWDTNYINEIENTKELIIFYQQLYYYYFNLKSKNKWLGSGCAPYGMMTPQEQRWASRAGQGIIIPAGWHYSAMGGPERLKYKYYNGSEYGIIDGTNRPEPDFNALINKKVLDWTTDDVLTFVDINKINTPKNLNKLIEQFPYLIGRD